MHPVRQRGSIRPAGDPSSQRVLRANPRDVAVVLSLEIHLNRRLFSGNRVCSAAQIAAACVAAHRNRPLPSTSPPNRLHWRIAASPRALLRVPPQPVEHSHLRDRHPGQILFSMPRCSGPFAVLLRLVVWHAEPDAREQQSPPIPTGIQAPMKSLHRAGPPLESASPVEQRSRFPADVSPPGSGHRQYSEHLARSLAPPGRNDSRCGSPRFLTVAAGLVADP